jgi:hypothetical protein
MLPAMTLRLFNFRGALPLRLPPMVPPPRLESPPRIHAFLFNWRGQFERARRTEAQLAEVLGRVTVINSDEEHTANGWIDVGDEYYFTAQYLEAIRRLDGDILFHVQADAEYDDWGGVVRNAVEAFERYGWGVFAPNADFTGWSGDRVDLGPGLLPSEPDLRMVINTDSIAWFVHGDIVRRMRRHARRLRGNRLGWGVDLLAVGLSYLSGRPVIRDYRHTIRHPRSRGYDTRRAGIECERTVSRFGRALRRYARLALTDRRSLSELLRRAWARPV